MNDALGQPAVRIFMICAAALTLKMIMTGIAVASLRTRRKVYATPEDYILMGGEPGGRDEQIERLRRAHTNDLENIVPFFAVGFLYALTGPSYTAALWLFAIFTVARILHTITYAMALQPWRTIVFTVGQVCLTVITVTLLERAF